MQWRIFTVLAGAVFVATASAASVVTPDQRETGFDPQPPVGFLNANPGAVRRASVPAVRADRDGSTGPGATQGAATSVRISGDAMAGSVNTFALSPNGTRAVYIADQDTLGRFELYSVPIDGSALPAKLSDGLPFGAGDQGVSAFLIDSDGSHVLFLADPNLGGGIDELYSVPIDGTQGPAQLSLSGEAPVTAFGVAPNGIRVGYFGVGPSGAVELYGASVGVSGSGGRLSNVGAGNAQGDVVAAGFSPDSSTVVFVADADVNDVFQWFSVSMTAGTAGSEVRLSDALNFVSLGKISPDSTTFVYTADEVTPLVMDLFAVPLAGGAQIRLNPAHGGNGVNALAISPDGSRVAYLADQNAIDYPELFSAQIAVAGSGTQLNAPFAPPQAVRTLTISPDSSTVVYTADENLPATIDLLAVPIDGSGAPTTLHGLTPPYNVSFFNVLGTPVLGRRVVYPVVGTAVEICSVPFDGGEPFSTINDPLGSGETLFNAYVPSTASRLMAFGVGTTTSGIASRIFAGPVRSDLTTEQVNATAASGALGALMYQIDSGEEYVVYLQDETTLGKPELYSRALDSDSDGVTNPQDNCPFVDNPAQDTVVFPYTVSAESGSRFGWGSVSEVRWARGSLSAAGSYVPEVTGTLADADALIDDATPISGAGYFYLFAADCSGRSYQTTPGAEPARDAGALP